MLWPWQSGVQYLVMTLCLGYLVGSAACDERGHSNSCGFLLDRRRWICPILMDGWSSRPTALGHHLISRLFAEQIYSFIQDAASLVASVLRHFPAFHVLQRIRELKKQPNTSSATPTSSCERDELPPNRLWSENF